MKKLTVGIFVDSFFPMTDGVAMVVDNYAKRLATFCEVIVFAPRYIGKPMDDSVFNYEVVRCSSIKLPFLDYSLPVPKLDRNFSKKIKKYHFDIIHIHSPFTVGKAGIRIAKKNNIPIVGTMHSQYKQDFLRAVRNKAIANGLIKKIIRVYNKCDECFTVNPEIARIYYEEYHYKSLPKIIPNATDMKKLENKEKMDKIINKKYHLIKNEKVFLFVGRINKLKNVFFIVDALKELTRQNSKFDFKMLFVGTGQDEKELKKYVVKLGLNDKVLFTGKITSREELAAIYARADLFLFPSYYDTNSLVQLEAASQNLPTLFAKGSGTSAMVSDNKNGYIEECDTKKYAKKIINIFKDSKLYHSVCENAYKDLYQTWDDVVNILYHEYLKVINKKKE